MTKSLFLTVDKKIIKIPTLTKNNWTQELRPYDTGNIYVCLNKKQDHLKKESYQKRKEEICRILKQIPSFDFQSYLEQLKSYVYHSPQSIYLPKLSAQVIESPYLTRDLRDKCLGYLVEPNSIKEYQVYLEHNLSLYQKDKDMIQKLQTFLASSFISNELVKLAPELEKIYVFSANDIVKAFSLNFSHDNELARWIDILHKNPAYLENLSILGPEDKCEKTIAKYFRFDSMAHLPQVYVWLSYSSFDQALSSFSFVENSANSHKTTHLALCEELSEAFGFFPNFNSALQAQKMFYGFNPQEGQYVLAQYEYGELKKLQLKNLIDSSNDKSKSSLAESVKIQEKLDVLLLAQALSHKIETRLLVENKSTNKFKM